MPCASTLAGVVVSSGLPEYLTLCMICRRAPVCELARVVAQPVWRCEEFESAPAAARLNGDAASADRNGAEGLGDLCSSCTCRGTCRFPRPSGGVWHCEGYH